MRTSGISTCVETSGYCAREVIERIARVTDLFLFDIKETDEELHRCFTGVSNRRILENLVALDSVGARVILRCPIVPEMNMRDAHFKGIAALAERTDAVIAIELEPYHPIGLSKYAALGQRAGYENDAFLDPAALRHSVSLIRELTRKPVRLSTGIELC